MFSIIIMYIFAAVSTFFIYQMLSQSYKDCINRFISDTFHLQEEKMFKRLRLKLIHLLLKPFYLGEDQRLQGISWLL